MIRVRLTAFSAATVTLLLVPSASSARARWSPMKTAKRGIERVVDKIVDTYQYHFIDKKVYGDYRAHGKALVELDAAVTQLNRSNSTLKDMARGLSPGHAYPVMALEPAARSERTWGTWGAWLYLTKGGKLRVGWDGSNLTSDAPSALLSRRDVVSVLGSSEPKYQKPVASAKSLVAHLEGLSSQIAEGKAEPVKWLPSRLHLLHLPEGALQALPRTLTHIGGELNIPPEFLRGLPRTLTHTLTHIGGELKIPPELNIPVELTRELPKHIRTGGELNIPPGLLLHW
jgi:hypothetical protein